MSEPLDAITQSRIMATIATHARPRAADRPCVMTHEIVIDLPSGVKSIATRLPAAPASKPRQRKEKPAKKRSKSKVDNGPPPSLPIPRIIWECAVIWDVPATVLTAHTRESRYIQPRHAAMAIIKKLLGMSKAAIGRHFNRDHTTVMQALAGLPERCEKDPDCERRYLEALHACQIVVPQSARCAQGDCERTSA